MTPILAKVLYIQGWDPAALYFAILLILSCVFATHEIAAHAHGERWAMTKEDFFGTALATLSSGCIEPIMFFVGLRSVAASDAAVLTSLLPFFVVVFSVIFLKEHFTSQTLSGGLLLGLGIVVLLWKDIVSLNMSTGTLLVLASSVLGALTVIIHKRYVKHRHLDSIVFVRTVLSAVIVGTWILLTNPSSLEALALPQNVWLFLALPICGFALPYFLFFRSLTKLTAMDTGFVFAAGRVIGILLAAALLNEVLTPTHALSIACMVIGMIVINVPLTKWRIVPTRLTEMGPLRK